LPLVAEIARIPEEIRGYGHVKERHLRHAKEKEARLLAQLNTKPQQTGLHAA
jgi:indolepyruvate ferredoxin oxidoreductase